MPTPGILVAKSHLLPSTTITVDTLIHWYHNIHIPDVLASEGAPPLAIHYTNAEPDAKWTNLVLYRLPDVRWVGSDAMNKIPKEWDGWEGPGGVPKRAIAFAEVAFRAYEQAHVYEGPLKTSERRSLKTYVARGEASYDCTSALDKLLTTRYSEVTEKGSYIVTVGIDIPDELDEEYDEWMQKQHLPMVSMVPAFRRSTRYILPPENRDSNWPKILVITEYSEPPPLELMNITRTTEWAKRMIGAFQITDKQGWNQVKSFGKANEGMELS